MILVLRCRCASSWRQASSRPLLEGKRQQRRAGADGQRGREGKGREGRAAGQGGDTCTCTSIRATHRLLTRPSLRARSRPLACLPAFCSPAAPAAACTRLCSPPVILHLSLSLSLAHSLFPPAAMAQLSAGEGARGQAGGQGWDRLGCGRGEVQRPHSSVAHSSLSNALSCPFPLGPGCIARVHRSPSQQQQTDGAIVQVLEVKKIEPKAGQSGDRYR